MLSTLGHTRDVDVLFIVVVGASQTRLASVEQTSLGQTQPRLLFLLGLICNVEARRDVKPRAQLGTMGCVVQFCAPRQVKSIKSINSINSNQVVAVPGDAPNTALGETTNNSNNPTRKHGTPTHPL